MTRLVTRPRIVYLSQHARATLSAVVLAGAGAFAVGIVVRPHQAWSALLTSGFFFLTVALGALVFLALNQVGHGGWSTVLHRVMEAHASWLVPGSAVLLALLAGLPQLYHWAHPGVTSHDPVLAAKSAWLSPAPFAARMAGILAVWLLFMWLLRRVSRARGRSVALSAAFLAVFAVTFSVASFDWLMSLEPHWQSTIYGLYHIAGTLVAGVAGITVTAILLARAGHLPQLTDDHVHDLARYLFGLSTFWAYLWICQYLLVWYANIPEEGTHFLARQQGGWGFLFVVNLVAGWALPFLVLLPRPSKRSQPHVFRVALWMLGARWLDIHLAVAPAGAPVDPGIGALDVAVLAGLGAAFILVVARTLGGAPLLSRADPYLAESLHHHT